MSSAENGRYVLITREQYDVLANLFVGFAGTPVLLDSESESVHEICEAWENATPEQPAGWHGPAAARAQRAETCADYGHDFEYLAESNQTVCKHCGLNADADGPA